MINRLSLILTCLTLSFLSSRAQTLPAPSEFLGYELGQQFTYHYRVMEYFKTLGEASPQVKIQAYGRTNEDRELLLAFVSSEANIKRLEEIRQDNLRATGNLEGESRGNQIPIVWLGYNIHGNESSSSEAAMATIHTLLTADTAKWLEDLVVVMDPCINPDGRDRYTNWYRQAVNAIPNALRESYEHHEPWPGGRFNHYLFDLNRDWAWQTQIETQQRALVYQQWMPHVNVDFHEMGPNSPYFFGPAAEPYHELITPWQKEFQKLTGQNHAHYFNQNGWLYFTKEVFDLFYPSYGDTWPTYQGAIGFTYEQGGSGSAGLRLHLPTGDTLSLTDRIAHHYTTGLSTIETAHRNRERLLKEFNAYFEKAQNEATGNYKTFVIKETNDSDRLQALLSLLDRNGIHYGYPANSGRSIKAYDYRQQKEGSTELSGKDILISTYQPQANLAAVLFEPEAKLSDSLTYDLTAWSLPYAYNLEAFASTEKLKMSEEGVTLSFQANVKQDPLPYSYLVEWKDLQDARFLSALLQAKIKARYANKAFQLEGKTYSRGTLIISRAENTARLDDRLIAIANAHQQTLIPVRTGFVEDGKDFGSNSVDFIKPAKVALVNGPGVRPSAFGELWHFFEQDLKYPVSVLNTSYLSTVDLSKFDVVILPQGNYTKFRGQLLNFSTQGGRLIALEGAIKVFTDKTKDDKTFTKLGKAYQELQKKEAKAKAEAAKKQEAEVLLKRYDARNREQISKSAPGSIYKVKLDDSNPLAFGEGSEVYLIKRNRTVYPLLPEGSWNVGAYRGQKAVSGFTGAKLSAKLDNTLAIGMEASGKGKIIYFVDSPIFRQFWHGGKLLLSNAVFF